MPKEDTEQEGRRFPFNACEILSSENNFIVDKLMEVVRIDEEDDDDSDSDSSVKALKKKKYESDDEEGSSEGKKDEESKEEIVNLDEQIIESENIIKTNEENIPNEIDNKITVDNKEAGDSVPPEDGDVLEHDIAKDFISKEELNEIIEIKEEEYSKNLERKETAANVYIH
jgi:hypothetical protein